jgi:hypothetical protein
MQIFTATRHLTRSHTPASQEERIMSHFDYWVDVHTGVEDGAGTDANVYISLIGERGKGHTWEFPLSKSTTYPDNAFESGHQDYFHLRRLPDFGRRLSVITAWG